MAVECRRCGQPRGRFSMSSPLPSYLSHYARGCDDKTVRAPSPVEVSLVSHSPQFCGLRRCAHSFDSPLVWQYNKLRTSKSSIELAK